ncbi:MAG: hypothetical protein JNM56_15155 [Planctomycetia bacterium]|nr:hypothetical protein [Planctomycetia bacterium]
MLPTANLPAVILASDAKPELITQAMLQEYQALKEATARRVALRQQIMERLDARAPVEDGPLTALVHEHEDHRFTYKNLITLLGEVRVAELKLQVKPIVMRQLIVHATPEEEEQGLDD